MWFLHVHAFAWPESKTKLVSNNFPLANYKENSDTTVHHNTSRQQLDSEVVLQDRARSFVNISVRRKSASSVKCG